VVTLMTNEGQVSLPALRVDGGAAANDFLCQAQATALGVNVIRASALETTGLGAAFLAGLGTAFWPSLQAISELVGDASTFTPDARDERAHLRWRTAVERSKGWALV
jgi:glycerol kinase